MREDAFRAFLAPFLTARGIDSYISNARRAERTLGIDLDSASIEREGTLATIAENLVARGYPAGSVKGTTSALRRYAAMVAGAPSRVLPPSEPMSSLPRHPVVTQATIAGLMRLYGDIIAELGDRGVSRTANGPVGDYAEYLFAAAFGWTLAANSESGYDARDTDGRRYQIKARRLSHPTASRQLSAIRRLPDKAFETLAAVLFDDTMRVRRAALIPHAVVASLATKVEHTNSWRLMLADRVWSQPGVVDATAALREAE